MPYKIRFKSRFTKNRWVENVNSFRTKADAKSTADYIKKQKDEKGKTLKTSVKIIKVK
jgi:hypothetical protein